VRSLDTSLNSSIDLHRHMSAVKVGAAEVLV
jgi:hypothetical protein